MDGFVPKEGKLQCFMEEGTPQRRKERSSAKRMPLKDFMNWSSHPQTDSSMEEGSLPKKGQRKDSIEDGISKKDKRYSMGQDLLPPQRSPYILELSTRHPTTDYESHSDRDARIFSRRSYDVFFCLPFLDWKLLEEVRNSVYQWQSFKWYSINIHADGPGTAYPKRLIPFWKGLIPMSSALAALGSHIYCLGGRNAAYEPLCDVYKLRVTPHAAKEWVDVSPRMISRRRHAHASVLGGKIYVLNNLRRDHTDPHWCEVFDPVRRKWEALPNPPTYLQDGLIFYAALENPNRIIGAFRVSIDTPPAAIFYEYNVQHRSWKELAPARRMLHPMYRFDWLERTLGVGNTLYWIERKLDEILLIAYDLDLDVWLQGPVPGLECGCIRYCEVSGGPGLPRLLHLEKNRFCVLECTLADDLHCMVIDVSCTREKTLGISVAWDQKYGVDPELPKGMPQMLSFCTKL